MWCHALHANGTAAHALSPTLAQTHARTGPVMLGVVDPEFLIAAALAASIWNSYLQDSRLPQKRYNVTAASLPGDIVGQIWLPCHSVCNVTVDPSYNAPVNVLAHEFGHGIGLPNGAVSSQFKGLQVRNHHWEPGDIDPRELMTAVLDPNPYISKYTLDAIAPHNHRGCLYDYHCSGSYTTCHDHSEYYPGRCSYTEDLYLESQFLIFLFVFLLIPIIICTSFGCFSSSNNDNSFGAL